MISKTIRAKVPTRCTESRMTNPRSKIETKWARQDSNLGPRDYESPALTAELQARMRANARTSNTQCPTSNSKGRYPGFVEIFTCRKSSLTTFSKAWSNFDRVSALDSRAEPQSAPHGNANKLRNSVTRWRDSECRGENISVFRIWDKARISIKLSPYLSRNR